MGDLLGGAKGMLVNFVVRSVKKMVPRLRAAGRGALQAMRWRRARAMTLTPVELGPQDVAFLQYTGGTTGVSKGATLHAPQRVANVLQTEAWIAAGHCARPPHVEQIVIVCALPLYHIFALTACAMWGMRVGALNILIPNPRDIAGFIKELAQVPVQHAAGGEHAVQRAAQPSGFAQARLLAA